MRRIVLSAFVVLIFALPLFAVFGQQPTGIYAEAILEANVRAAIGTDAQVVTKITAGTRYPVVGRSQFYPWLLIGDPSTFQPIGWVYQDLVTVIGDVNAVPFTEASVDAQPTPIAPQPTADSSSGVSVTTAPTPSPSPTPNFTVYGNVSGEINLRYGPGVDYPRVGVAQAGTQLEIVGYSTQFEWVQVTWPEAPQGVAWVAINLLEIQGDIYSTTPVSRVDFSSLPTLTPTPAVLQSSLIRREGTPVPVSPEFAMLGQSLVLTRPQIDLVRYISKIYRRARNSRLAITLRLAAQASTKSPF